MKWEVKQYLFDCCSLSPHIKVDIVDSQKEITQLLKEQKRARMIRIKTIYKNK